MLGTYVSFFQAKYIRLPSSIHVTTDMTTISTFLPLLRNERLKCMKNDTIIHKQFPFIIQTCVFKKTRNNFWPDNTGQQRFCPMRKNVCFLCICGRRIQICFHDFSITHTFRSRLKGWNLLSHDTSGFLPWAPWRIHGFLLPGRWCRVLQWRLFRYGSSWTWI